VYPALQMQALRTVLVLNELENAGQFEHTASPFPALYLALPHGVHVPPVPPVYPGLQVQVFAFPHEYPALQMQALRTVLALNELENAGQFEHTALPFWGLYVAAPHGVHVPPFSPVYPALQVQAVRAVLAFNELDNAGQFKHAPLPLPALYVPAPHAVHVSSSLPVYPALHMQAYALATLVDAGAQIQSNRSPFANQ
jgi:uncharacterized protein (DUF952 family)